MEYKKIPCEVVTSTSFETYEECAQYMMIEHEAQTMNKESRERAYPFEKYFVKILREHPVLYDEKHRDFGKEFPTKHAWCIVAGYIMMESEAVQDVWKTFQKFAGSGIQLYVDLVNYVKLGDGKGWIDTDDDEGSDTSGQGNSSIKEEDEVNFSIKMEVEEECGGDDGEGSFQVKDEFVKAEIE